MRRLHQRNRFIQVFYLLDVLLCRELCFCVIAANTSTNDPSLYIITRSKRHFKDMYYPFPFTYPKKMILRFSQIVPVFPTQLADKT